MRLSALVGLTPVHSFVYFSVGADGEVLKKIFIGSRYRRHQVEIASRSEKIAHYVSDKRTVLKSSKVFPDWASGPAGRWPPS